MEKDTGVGGSKCLWKGADLCGSIDEGCRCWKTHGRRNHEWRILGVGVGVGVSGARSVQVP